LPRRREELCTECTTRAEPASTIRLRPQGTETTLRQAAAFAASRAATATSVAAERADAASTYATRALRNRPVSSTSGQGRTVLTHGLLEQVEAGRILSIGSLGVLSRQWSLLAAQVTPTTTFVMLLILISVTPTVLLGLPVPLWLLAVVAIMAAPGDHGAVVLLHRVATLLRQRLHHRPSIRSYGTQFPGIHRIRHPVAHPPSSYRRPRAPQRGFWGRPELPPAVPRRRVFGRYTLPSPTSHPVLIWERSRIPTFPPAHEARHGRRYYWRRGPAHLTESSSRAHERGTISLCSCARLRKRAAPSRCSTPNHDTTEAPPASPMVAVVPCADPPVGRLDCNLSAAPGSDGSGLAGKQPCPPRIGLISEHPTLRTQYGDESPGELGSLFSFAHQVALSRKPQTVHPTTDFQPGPPPLGAHQTQNRGQGFHHLGSRTFT